MMGSRDPAILAALGDKFPNKIIRARIALAHSFHFLKAAERNEKHRYLFYVNDDRVVFVLWGTNGWLLDAMPVSYSLSEWLVGDVVVSSWF